jgi:hypothetical protein
MKDVIFWAVALPVFGMPLLYVAGAALLVCFVVIVAGTVGEVQLPRIGGER